MIKTLSAAFCFSLALSMTACSVPVTTALPPAAPADATGDELNLALPSGYRAELLVDGLVGPTQMIFSPNGQLWVAQLAGGENANRGEVVAVDLATGVQTTLLIGLDKPTGLALLDGALWIATRRDLLPPRRWTPTACLACRKQCWPNCHLTAAPMVRSR